MRIRARAVTVGILLCGSVDQSFAADPIQITTHPGLDLCAAWSPDGSQIAFSSDRSGNRDIWVIASAGGVATQITTHVADDTSPTWSPDGLQIAFGSIRSSGGIYRIPAIGGLETQVTTSGQDRLPAWRPIRPDVIAFTRLADIYTIQLGGFLPVPLTSTPLPVQDSGPTWSPDGDNLAIASNRSGNFDIWIVPASGGPATQLTSDPSIELASSWSPDGSLIAFDSTRSGNQDIWVIPASGGTATQITSDLGSDTCPSWSPDGSKIAFVSDRSGNFDIWVISVTTVGIEADSWSGVKNRYRD